MPSLPTLGTRTLAALFVVALVAGNWALLLTPLGYGGHVGVAVLVLVLERAVWRGAPSPCGWIRWRDSLLHFVRVVLVSSACLGGLLLVTLLVIRIGEFRFELSPQNVRHPSQFWWWFWPSVVWAPLVEEWIYRGLIQPRLRLAFGSRWAIFICGLLFWVYHWVSFGEITAPNHLLAGWLFAWSWQRTGSLVAPTLLHALGNLTLGLGDMLVLTEPEFVASVLGW